MFSKLIYAVLVCFENQQKAFFLIIRTYIHCDSLDKYSIKNKYMWINLLKHEWTVHERGHSLLVHKRNIHGGIFMAIILKMF